MANMNTTMVSNPMGRWWHPLPLISPLVLVIGSIIMKLTGLQSDMSWRQVIAYPIIFDVAVNALVLSIWAVASWISNIKDRHQGGTHT